MASSLSEKGGKSPYSCQKETWLRPLEEGTLSEEGAGRERTQARKTGPRAQVSTRSPAARSKGRKGARGRGAPLYAPSESWPRRGEAGVCTPGMAPGDPFGVCVKALAVTSRSYAFPTPRCSYLPSALTRPTVGVPCQKSNSPTNKETCPGFVAGELWPRGLPPLTSSAFIGIWESPSLTPLRPQHRRLSALRAPTAAALALVLTGSPVSRWMMQPAQGLLCLFFFLLLLFFFFPSFHPS